MSRGLGPRPSVGSLTEALTNYRLSLNLTRGRITLMTLSLSLTLTLTLMWRIGAAHIGYSIEKPRLDLLEKIPCHVRHEVLYQSHMY